MPRTKKTIEKNLKEETKIVKTQNNKKIFISVVGRRREAKARVRLYPDIKEDILWGDKTINKGQIFVNQKPIEEYFSSEVEKVSYSEPLRTTNTLGKFTFTIKVEGGGKNGQLEALVNGIARALEKYDKEKFRPILKKKGFLTRDARTRERRKVGRGGKARRLKQSPKR